MKTPWEYRYAQRTERIKGSAIRELLKLTSLPGVISFGGGMPAPDAFPVAEIQAAANRVLQNSSEVALQYGTTEGYTPLREMIARRSVRYGLDVTPDNILITAGSQQALDLIGKVFINNGDRILVESPTYLGALQAWNAYGADYIPVPSDEKGMIIDGLEESLRIGPKFIYVLPNFQNPTGVTMPEDRRKNLSELADRYGLPIVEDDPYGQLRFEGHHLPAVSVLDAKMRGCETVYTGNVIYLSTFSKTLAPGLRLAWVIAPEEVIHKLAQAKQGVDLHTATFTQMLAYEVGKDGFIDEHVLSICKLYRHRRDVMLDALEEHMPTGVRWTHPEGGLFLWVTLPEKINTTDMMPEAIKEKVAYVPGESFFPRGGGQNTMRLNFSYANDEKINEGIGRLGTVIKKALK